MTNEGIFNGLEAKLQNGIFSGLDNAYCEKSSNPSKEWRCLASKEDSSLVAREIDRELIGIGLSGEGVLRQDTLVWTRKYNMGDRKSATIYVTPTDGVEENSSTAARVKKDGYSSFAIITLYSR